MSVKKSVIISLLFPIVLSVLAMAASAAIQFPSSSINNTNPKKNNIVQIGANALEDATLISMAIFSWNGTSSGIWVNASNSSVVDLASINYSVNVPVPLAGGNVIGYQFYANNSAGAFANSPLQLFTVGNTPPLTPAILSPSEGLYTNMQPLILQVTFPTDIDNDIISIDYYINGTKNQTSLTNATLNASDGHYKLYVSINDGFASSSNDSVNFVIDTTPPSVSGLRSNDTDNITRNNVLINFTVTAADINFVNVSLNGTLMPPIGSGQYRLQSNASSLGCINEGACLLNATALDLAGNRNSIAYSLIIDNTPPAMTGLIAKNDTDNITRLDNTINFTLSVIDSNINYVNLNGTPMSQGTNEFYLVATPSVLGCTNGICLLTAAAADKADNQNTLAYSLTTDNLNPNVDLVLPQNNANVSGIAGLRVSVVDLIASISSVRAINGTKIYAMSLFSGTEGNGIYNLTINTKTLPNGPAVFRFNATDRAGNYNDSLGLNLIIDNMPPKVLAFNGIVANNAAVAGNVTVNATASDNITGIKGLSFSLNGTTSSILNPVREGNTFAVLLQTKSFSDGSYNITAIPEDFAGNKEADHLLISEVLFDPAGSDAGSEWVEIYNPTNAPIDINSWDIKSKARTLTFNASVIVPPKTALVIADNATKFNLSFGFLPDVDGTKHTSSFLSTNSDDFIQLRTPSNDIADEVSWGNNGDGTYNWSLQASEGLSITRAPAGGDVNEQYDWQSNAAPTPKAPTAPNHITIKIDNTPPQVSSFNGNVVNGSFLKGAQAINATILDALSQVNAVKFTINGSGSGAIILSPSQEGNNWNASFDSSSLADGKYNISVFSNDTLGNINTAEFIEVTVDNNPPRISNLLPLNSSFINTTTALVKFTLKDNASGVNISSSAIQLNYFLNDIGPIPAALNAPVAISGGHELNVTLFTSTAQKINLTVSAKDNNGNVMPTALWSYTVDVSKPTVTNIQLNDTDRLLRSIDVLNITINSSNGLAGIKNVTIGSSTILGLSNVYSTIWQIVAPASAFGCTSDGTCMLGIAAEDNAGNVNNSESVRLTIDNTNPRVNNIFINNTIVSNVTPIKFNLTINDANFAIGTVAASNASTVTLSNATTAPYWVAEATASALGCSKNGVCTIHFKATDSTGNINFSETAAISTDSSPPSITSAVINDSNNIVKGIDAVNMSLGVVDINSIVSIAGNNVNFAQVGGNWNAVNKSSEFCPAEGICTVAFAVQDNLGNSNSTQTFAFTIDNTPPSLSNIGINATNNITKQDGIVNFSVTAADANDISSLFLNSTPLSKLNNAVWSTVNKTSSLCGSNEGNCTLQFVAADNAGNIQALSFRMLVDTSNPRFTVNPSSPSTKFNTLNVTLNVTWSDPSGIAGVTFSHNATGSFQSYAGIPSSNDFILLINASLLKNQQVIGWNSTAFDIAGNLNSSMAVQTFKIENRGPAFASIPTITMQEDNNATLELSSFYSDADSDSLAYSIAVQPESIAAAINSTSGSVKLVPAANLFGLRYIIFNATDGLSHAASNNVTINITNVNDAPVVSIIPNIMFNEDSYNDSLNLDDFVEDADNSDSQIIWTAAVVSNPNIFISIANNRVANITAAGNFSGAADAFFRANDSTSAISSNLFTITVNQVNDAPTTPVLTSPAVNSVFSATSVTLSWQASKDNESSPITYYIFNSNDTTPRLNASTALTSYTIANLALGRTYYWAVLASDGSLNSTLSEIRQYSTVPNLPPNITSFYPNAASISIPEGSSQKFNITKSDIDNNIANVTWLLDGSLKAVNDTNFTYAPNITAAGVHTVTAVVTDLFSAASSVSWTVTVTNLNQPPVLSVPAFLLNATENALFTFNITASDPDNDALAFNSNRSDVIITKFNYTAVINWTPANSDVGVAVLRFNVTDAENLSDTKTVSINVSNVNDAPVITAFFPPDNPIIAELAGAQLFNITASDPDAGDTLTIIWKLNGAVNTTGISFTAANLSARNYTVTANASDGRLSAVKSWNLTVSAIPVSKKYMGPIFSLNKSQLENAANVTLNHTTLGAIDFKNNTLNLSGIVDIDNAVNISKGVTAINTEKYPQLNKSARIVWKGLNFTKSPFIFYNPGFKAEGNSLCPIDVCTNVTYDKAKGVLEFDVAHFSAFFAGQNTTNDPPKITSAPPTSAALNDPFSYSIAVSDLDNSTFIFTLPSAPSGMSISPAGVVSWVPKALGSFNATVNVSDGIAHDTQSFAIMVTEGARLRVTDLDVKIDGKSSKNLRNNSVIRREAEPGSKVEFSIEVRNGFSSSDDMDIEDIETEVTIEGIDDGDDLEFDANEFDLRAGRDKSVKAKFDIPLAVDEDTFDVLIKVEGEDQNGTRHMTDWKLELEIDKESHKLMLDKASLSPEKVSCDRQLEVSADVINLGEEEEDDVQVAFTSEALELDKDEQGIFLDSGTEDISETIAVSFRVRDDLAEGTYPIEIKAYRDNDKLEDSKSVSLNVGECIQEKKQVEKEKVVVVKPAQPSQQPAQVPAGKLRITPPASLQKPALKETTKISFRETDEYTLLLIATVVTLTVGIFVIGGLVLMNMRR